MPGLTEAKLTTRGFIGKKNLSYSNCENGRPRVRFDLAAGAGDNIYKFPNWFHCVIYGDMALKLKKLIKPGVYLWTKGYLQTEADLDEYHRPIKDAAGEVKKNQTYIVESAGVIEHRVKQPRLPLAVVSPS